MAGSGLQVQISEPSISGPTSARCTSSCRPGASNASAGQDYVDYDFNLTSGAYKTTYKRADGPNAETSQVTTPNYMIGFDDRWIRRVGRSRSAAQRVSTSSTVRKPDSRSAPADAATSTFADGEGRVHRQHRRPGSRHPLVRRCQQWPAHRAYARDVSRPRGDADEPPRVHAIPGIMDYLDYSTAAIGMTYQNSENQTAVTINGAADAVSTAIPTWELVTGAQGSVMVVGQVNASIIPRGRLLDTIADGFYRDELNSPVDQCWGDAHFLGASGLNFVAAIPNTDPAADRGRVRLEPHRSLRRAGSDRGHHLDLGEQRGNPVSPDGHSVHVVTGTASDLRERSHSART